VALDQNYVSQEKFDKIYNQADKRSRLISGLIKYLRANERRYQQEKLKKPKKPDKPDKPDRRDRRDQRDRQDQRDRPIDKSLRKGHNSYMHMQTPL
jgi:hypothetical protein